MSQTTSGIFRRKPIRSDDDETLERSIGRWQLTAIGLGAIIGAGIFALAGPVAKSNAGPAVTISFLIAGFASACAALSYAEFGGLIPQAGSAYTYGYAVLGEAAGWFIGWDLLLEYTAIVAVVAIAVCRSTFPSWCRRWASISRRGCWGPGHGSRSPRGPLRGVALSRSGMVAQPRHQEQRPGRDLAGVREDRNRARCHRGGRILHQS